MELSASAELISTEKQLGLNLLAGCQIELVDLPASRFDEAVAKIKTATSPLPLDGSGARDPTVRFWRGDPASVFFGYLLGGVAADATLSDSKACATRQKLITALTHSGTCPQLIKDFARLPNTVLKEWVYMSMNAPQEDDNTGAMMRLKLSEEEAVAIQKRLSVTSMPRRGGSSLRIFPLLIFRGKVRLSVGGSPAAGQSRRRTARPRWSAALAPGAVDQAGPAGSRVLLQVQ
jgi:hypothetical protein